ncbi:MULTISPECIES: TerC family protein [unclassified Brachybacterium]|uniref:TerC family protein n=1 Tax=unclassified Brachybacterium TaxID=2623841 RepID=UPI00360ED2AF
MTVSPLIWALTIAVIVGLLAFDYIFHVRKAHIPTLREAAVWSSIYIAIAVVFGLLVLLFGGGQAGGEYFAGYITEKALSVDNLFVFLVIMSSFRVPREDQQKVLLFGITFAIIARTGLIAGGAAIIEHFAWAFYFFGLILLLTAGNMLKPEDEDKDDANNFVVRLAKRVLPTTDVYDGDRLTTQVDGKRVMTPMLLVMVAVGGTDVLFALDSIPAIFGLTQNTFIVFTATVFSLLGLRQLYFLLDGLLDRLVYLSYGLAAILGFIGVKLILHALHENELGIINHGEPVPVPEVTTSLSLGVIITVLTLTVIASLVSRRGRAQNTVSSARRDAEAYVSMTYTSFEQERERVYRRLMENEEKLKNLPEKYQDLVHEEKSLSELLDDAHAMAQKRWSDRQGGTRSDEHPEGLSTIGPDGKVRKDADGNILVEDPRAGSAPADQSRDSASREENDGPEER